MGNVHMTSSQEKPVKIHPQMPMSPSESSAEERTEKEKKKYSD
jgi:hypothetical protein